MSGAHVSTFKTVMLAALIGGMVALMPGVAATADATSGRAPGLILHRDQTGPRDQSWTAPRRWSTANDWEPNVAASKASAWVYQMTTRYSHPSQCARGMSHCIVFRASADHGRTWRAARPLPRRYCPPHRRCVLAKEQNDPVLQVSSTGVIFAAWMNDWDVTFMRSSDHGRTWHDAVDFRRAAGLSFTDKPWLALFPVRP